MVWNLLLGEATITFHNWPSIRPRKWSSLRPITTLFGCAKSTSIFRMMGVIVDPPVYISRNYNYYLGKKVWSCVRLINACESFDQKLKLFVEKDFRKISFVPSSSVISDLAKKWFFLEFYPFTKMWTNSHKLRLTIGLGNMFVPYS